MPPDRPKKFFNYEDDNMKAAIEAVRNGMSKKQAARTYNVPRSSLVRRVSGKVAEGKKMGPPSVLSEVEENKLKNWLLTIAKKGYPIHRSILLDTVKRVLDEQKRTTIFKDNRPGITWWEAYKRRHPIISEKEAEGLTLARASVSEVSVRKWFADVETWLKKEGHFDILNDPSRIFNADESGFLLCPKTGRVIGEKGCKEDFYVITSNKEKEQLTVMAAFSADGVTVPPMVVYPYVRLPREVSENVPDSWGIGITPNGWMNGDLFFEWVSNHFIPYVESQMIEFPIILFVDGHRSHLTMQASELCEAKQVILVALHPNCTHMLQPADVSIFKPLKAGWKQHVREWKYYNNYQEVVKSNFAPLLENAFKERATPLIIQNGFRACGLYPFEPNSVDYTKCIKHRKTPIEQSADESINTFEEKCLKYFETKITPETLVKFKQSGEEWKGEEKSKDLFDFWKSLSKPAETNTENQESVEEKGQDELYEEPLEEQRVSGMEILPTPSTSNSNQEPVTPGSESNKQVTGTPSTAGQSASEREASLLKYRPKNVELVSPFKKYLLIPKTPEKDAKGRPKRKLFPFSVVSAKAYREFLTKKDEEKGMKNKNQKKKRPAKKTEENASADLTDCSTKGKSLVKNKKKKRDWKCHKCQASWNEEVKEGIATRWIECENCKGWVHARCVSKKHCEHFGFHYDDSDSDEDEIHFICEKCVHIGSDIDDFDPLTSDSDNEEKEQGFK